MIYEEYKHIKCSCGGIIGIYSRYKCTCNKCNKEYQLRKLNYDALISNEKTGWIFPMIEINKTE